MIIGAGPSQPYTQLCTNRIYLLDANRLSPRTVSRASLTAMRQTAIGNLARTVVLLKFIIRPERSVLDTITVDDQMRCAEKARR
ncbi:MAG: hypothetical protein CBB77_02535 [Hyphomonas sp. TMED17]|nr:MAG: hypothetical protein CBB77_02535 [Hyphomonas sp. TMED17]